MPQAPNAQGCFNSSAFLNVAHAVRMVSDSNIGFGVR
jgi:hypothetical protein